MEIDDVTKQFVLLVLGIIVFIVAIIAAIVMPTVDYSDMESMVKVQETGTRYAVLWFGEQSYIRVQNVYSDQFASSSESWETCIRPEDVKFFQDVKNNKTPVNIHVKGNGISTIFKCRTGDLVIGHSP